MTPRPVLFPSAYEQLSAKRVGPDGLIGHSRHYNPGLVRFEGKLWMCYRSHRDDGHCETAIARIDAAGKPVDAQWLALPRISGLEHCEDGRLFIFRNRVHISYTEMTGYSPGKQYECCIKYARLSLKGKKWSVDEVFWPQYGDNHGKSREKNWQFFDYEGALHAVYATGKTHWVVRLEKSEIVEVYQTPGFEWPWGTPHGGTPPVRMGKDTFLSVFQSRRTLPDPPWFRYYGAAYTFEAKPPFRILSVSTQPFMAGSRSDRFAIDPRHPDISDPLVVFPCGLVANNQTSWLVSFGVNNWQCAIATMPTENLRLVPEGTAVYPTRYFMTENATLPVQVADGPNGLQWLPWGRVRRAFGGSSQGYASITDPCIAEDLIESGKATEITAAEFAAVGLVGAGR